MPTGTLIGAHCDPECKWAKAIVEVSDKSVVEKAALPVHFPYGDDDPRFTDESYAAAEVIDEELLGIRVLMAASDSCTTRACKIEEVVDRTDVNRFGSRIIEIVTDLKGE